MPDNFSVEDYLACNPDLQQAFQGNSYGAIVHFLKHGRQEGRLYARDQLFFADQPRSSAIQPALQAEAVQRVAILVQLHPITAWAEVRTLIQNFAGQAFDLLIGVTEKEWTPELHARLRQDCTNARILIIKNQAREMSAYLALMHQVVWQEYDIVCLIHAARQSTSARKTPDAIVGSKASVEKNLAMLRGNEAIGVIGLREKGQNTVAFQSAFQSVAQSTLLVKCQVLQPIYDRFQSISEAGSEAGSKAPSDTASGMISSIDSNSKNSNHQGFDAARNNSIEQTLERLISYLTHAQGLQIYWQESP